MTGPESSAWEPFDPRAARSPQYPAVTIRAVGTFGLNAAALAALGHPARVTLLFNPQERCIGLRAASDDDPRAYRVRTHADSQSYMVSGSGFLHHHGLAFEVACRFRAELTSPGLLVIDLSEGSPVGRHRQRKSGSHP